MFLSLSLKDFKKHASLQVNFEHGLNGVFGNNYKGKSTILYALLYALGGATHVPGNRLARRGSDGRFSVEATFRIPHEMYKLDYRVVRTKSTANLFEMGKDEPIASGTTAVNEKIEELIGMPVKQWKELHYAKQKNTHSLLRYSAGNLHSLLRRLVGAEELDQVQQRLKRLADKEEGLIEGLPVIEHPEAECAEHLAAALQAVTSSSAKVAELQAEVDGLAANEQQGLNAIQKAQTRLVAAQGEKGAAETLGARIDAATRGVEAARGIVTEREQLHAQATEKRAALNVDPAAGEKIAKHESLKLKRAAAERGVERTTARLVELTEKLVEAKPKLEESQRAFAELADSLGDVEARIAAATAARDTANQELAVARQRVKDLDAAMDGASCPTCQRPFEDHDPAALQEEQKAATQVVTEKLAAAGQLGKTLEAATSDRDVLAQRRRNLDAEELAAKNLVQEVEEATSAKEGADWELSEVSNEEAELGLTEEDITALRNQSQERAFADQSVKTTEAELKKAQAALASAELALQQLGGKEAADVAALTAEIEKLTKQLQQDRTTLAQLREALDEMRNAFAKAAQLHAQAKFDAQRWEKALKTAKEAGEKRVVAEKRLARIRHLQKHLKDNAEGYMGKVWAAFLAQASRIASQCTGGDIQGLDRDESGAFTFLEDGEQMQLEEASGAQEAIIGLAVQLALSSAAPCHLNVLLLDEPTADMDPDCSLATMAAMKAIGQQVIFVSHQQNDNTLCDNAITL